MNRKPTSSGLHHVFSVGGLLFGLALPSGAGEVFPSWTQGMSDAGKDRYVDVELNPELFHEVWTAPLVGGFGYYDRAVATDGERLYRTTSNIPEEGQQDFYRVLALDLDDGSVAWERPLRGYFHPQEVGEPAVMDGVVYVNREGHSASSYLPDHPRLYGLDATTGEVVSETLYQMQHGTKDRPTLVDGHVIAAGGYYGGLYSFGVDGGVQWFNNSGGTTETSVVAGDKIYRAWGDVLDLASGLAADSVTHPDGLRLNNPLVTEDGLLLYTAYDTGNLDDRRIALFDRATQTHLRDISVPGIPQAMAAGGGKLFAMNSLEMWVYDLDTGVNHLEMESKSGLIGFDFILTREHVLVRMGGELHAINTTTGDSEWSMAGHGRDSIALGDGLLIVSCEDSIIAFDATIPEPASLWIVAIGVLGLPIRCRQRRAD